MVLVPLASHTCPNICSPHIHVCRAGPECTLIIGTRCGVYSSVLNYSSSPHPHNASWLSEGPTVVPYHVHSASVVASHNWCFFSVACDIRFVPPHAGVSIV